VPKRQRSVAEDEACVPDVVDDDRAVRQPGKRRPPDGAIAGPIESGTAPKPFLGQAPVQLCSGYRYGVCKRAGGRVPVGAVRRRPARRARAVPGCERDCVVEEEEGRPAAGLVQWLALAPVGREANDPEIPLMVSDEAPGSIDEAAAVSGEQAAGGNGLQVAPGVDAVAARRHRFGHFRPRRERSDRG
jgi:hypothetical protein